MNRASKEFKKQLELDILISGLTEVTSEYVSTFKWKKFDEIVIPEGVTSIGDSAFSDCFRLIDITIGKGVTSIEDYAFWYCYKLKSITIPVSVAKIGEEAFYSCDGIKMTFEGKTLKEVRSMDYYPWGLQLGPYGLSEISSVQVS